MWNFNVLSNGDLDFVKTWKLKWELTSKVRNIFSVRSLRQSYPNWIYFTFFHLALENIPFQWERNSFQIYPSVATTTLVGAREKSTTKNYLGYFNEWSSWTGQYPEISILPAKETYVVIYLLYLFQIGKSYSTICLIYQAINCFYSIVRHPKPCDSKPCLNILEGLKRTTRYTVQTKSRIIVKHLYNLYSHFGGQRMSLSNLRIMLFESFP